MSTAIMAFLVLISPGIVASLLHTYLQRDQPFTTNTLWVALVYAFIINMFMFGLLMLSGKGASLIGDLLNTVSSTVKYGGVALLTALALPNIYTLISKITLRAKA